MFPGQTYVFPGHAVTPAPEVRLTLWLVHCIGLFEFRRLRLVLEPVLFQIITEAGSASRSWRLPAYEAVEWGWTHASPRHAAQVPGMQKHERQKEFLRTRFKVASGSFLG